MWRLMAAEAQRSGELVSEFWFRSSGERVGVRSTDKGMLLSLVRRPVPAYRRSTFGRASVHVQT